MPGKMVWKQGNGQFCGCFSRLGETWFRPELNSGNGEEMVDSEQLRIGNLQDAGTFRNGGGEGGEESMFQVCVACVVVPRYLGNWLTIHC